jgi:Raf kinase inhibitor-like YbhB/YbcL family protein
MTTYLRAALIAAAAASLAGPALAQEQLEVTIAGLQNGVLPDEAAFCIPDAETHQKPGQNVSPALSWSEGPPATQSYAVIMVDPDVPTEFENFNKEGATLPADMPRQDFFHWVLVDIPAEMTSLAEGADTGEASPKPPGETDHGRRGVNDYTKFMSGEQAGQYGGYDGPCPPWNDERMHNYTFHVYALDVPSLGLSGDFTGPDALAAIEGHVLAQGEAAGTYTLNPAMR